jgi:hypothetical protein
LRLSKSIVKLSLVANPIGRSGMRQLMKAKNENAFTDFELDLKLCDSEVEMGAEGQGSVFDPSVPEGSYELNLAKQYD